jgi:hypothetical protein
VAARWQPAVNLALATDPVVQAALQAAAALLFALSAAHKWRDPVEFRSALAAYGVIPDAAVAPVGALIAFGETALGVAFLFPAAGAAAGIGGALLLSLYAVAVAVNLARGRDFIDCGCGGPGGKRPISRGLALRNGVLAAALLLVALPSQTRATSWVDAFTAVSLLAALTLLYAAVDVALANGAKLRINGGTPWNTA